MALKEVRPTAADANCLDIDVLDSRTNQVSRERSCRLCLRGGTASVTFAVVTPASRMRTSSASSFRFRLFSSTDGMVRYYIADVEKGRSKNAQNIKHLSKGSIFFSLYYQGINVVIGIYHPS